MKPLKDLSSRELSIKVIKEIENGRALQETLDHYLNKNKLNSSDKALATNLVYGYFRLKNRLLFVLKNRIRQFKKLPNRFLHPMCLAVYEILYLDRIPDYATVNFYVEYIKKNVDKKLVGLSNGVLRNICREKNSYLHKDFYKNNTKNEIEFFEVYYSIPQKILELLLNQYTIKQARCFLEKSIDRPYIGIRINKKLVEAVKLIENLELEKKYILKHETRIYGFDQFEDVDKLEQRGILSKKSFESQIILQQIKCFVKEPIWDICAGIGGKLTYFLEEDICDIWASDVDFKKLIYLKKELLRLKLKEILVFLADGTKNFPLKKAPNTIILDVPCTGFGVLSRRPDIKYRFNEKRLKDLLQIQKRLLENSIEFLPAGGILVYITCTWNKMENGDMIEGILGKYDYLNLLKEIDFDFCSKYREFFYCAVLKKQ